MKFSRLSPPGSSSRPDGFILIVVLGILVIVLTLIVGFLSRVRTERKAGSTYYSGAVARQLGDIAVNVVQAQIQHATRHGTDTGWASQPGMIRTFGAKEEAYKLYSAPEMVKVGFLPAEDAAPPNWAQQKAVWVDLNEPVGTGTSLAFPIADPKAFHSGLVEAASIDSLTKPPGSDLPMPVRWLYVLEDGRLVVPEVLSGTRVRVPGANKDNPVMGRIAFWTDDESCKVNVNTAGEGVYWDMPRAAALTELEFSRNQPVMGEFTRYPGHPGTTALSSVFANLGFDAEKLLGNDVAPRYAWGGSKGGKVPHQKAEAINPASHAHRLYTSVDEMFLRPDRTPQLLFEEEYLAPRRFFLTAHSRAPETTLTNLPRTAIWPIHSISSEKTRSTLDQQIARASTISGNPYYFQRSNPFSSTADWLNIPRNQKLFGYLDHLTQMNIPGVNKSLAQQHGNGTERRQILTEIVDYIRCANTKDFSIMKKWGVNYTFSPRAHVIPFVHPVYETMGFGRHYTLSELGLLFICTADGSGQETPPPAAKSADWYKLRSNSPPSESPEFPVNKTLDVKLDPNQRRVEMLIVLDLTSVAMGTPVMQANMFVEITGLHSLKLNGQSLFPHDSGVAKITGGGQIQSDGFSYGASPGYRTSLLLRRAESDPAVPPPPNLHTSLETTIEPYPFISLPVTVTIPAGEKMSFTGGELHVRLYGRLDKEEAPRTEELFQTIRVNLPSASLPVPRLVVEPGPALAPQFWWTFSRTPATSDAEMTTNLFGGRLLGLGYPGESSIAVVPTALNQGNLIFPKYRPTAASYYDVYRSVAPRHGDYRLLARREVPADVYQPVGSWESSDPLISNLMGTFRPRDNVTLDFEKDYLGYLGQNLVEDAPYNRRSLPRFRPSPSGTPDQTGDFDSGMGWFPDGPYINKPDEGNTYADASNDPYFNTGKAEGLREDVFFSPTRQMPSAGVFGSLPTGVMRGIPWQTLLFRPQEDHPGFQQPRDHYWMDNFWMPVVEPYRISDPFSTAGKINLNYAIMPFTYLRRATGLAAVLKGEKIAAIPLAGAGSYKNSEGTEKSGIQTRLDINVPATLRQFDERFAAHRYFQSATEICDIHMIPQGVSSAAEMEDFWKGHKLTGDNLRERIYATVYPRITTKSNVFTVHCRAQAIRIPPGSVEIWDEEKGGFVAEYRGSTTIERNLNPNNPQIPDYASAKSVTELQEMQPLEDFYQWRVLATRQFSP